MRIVAAGDPVEQLLPSDERDGGPAENERVPDADHDSDTRRHVNVSVAERERLAPLFLFPCSPPSRLARRRDRIRAPRGPAPPAVRRFLVLDQVTPTPMAA